MIAERINRVINNHQFTCQHRSHYLFILKGFEPLMSDFDINVKPLELENLPSKTNYYITYENAFLLDKAIWNDLEYHNYDLWIVDFNLFDNAHLANNEQHLSYNFIETLDDYALVKYNDSDNFSKAKILSIFNTINPLIGIVENPKEKLNNTQRIAILK